MNEDERYISPALRAELAKWAPTPTYQDSAGGLTPTPLRAYSPAQQALLKSAAPTSIQAKRAKVGKERG